MHLTDVTFRGPAIDDEEILDALPGELSALLRSVNGFVAFRGGLHVRGACIAPSWHSLREAWRGTHSLSSRYPAVLPGDVPFGQDGVGDQFLWRDGAVLRLAGETGELTTLGVGLEEFLSRAQADPLQFLALEPLQQFEAEGGRLGPGQLLSVYPPFCTSESARGVSLRAIPVEERLAFLAEFAAAVREAPDGQQVRIVVED